MKQIPLLLLLVLIACGTLAGAGSGNKFKLRVYHKAKKGYKYYREHEKFLNFLVHVGRISLIKESEKKYQTVDHILEVDPYGIPTVYTRQYSKIAEFVKDLDGEKEEQTYSFSEKTVHFIHKSGRIKITYEEAEPADIDLLLAEEAMPRTQDLVVITVTEPKTVRAKWALDANKFMNLLKARLDEPEWPFADVDPDNFKVEGKLLSAENNKCVIQITAGGPMLYNLNDPNFEFLGQIKGKVHADLKTGLIDSFEFDLKMFLQENNISGGGVGKVKYKCELKTE
ncbi:hypothetical protein ACFL54_02545 [Planctomycetota bacterium]